MIAYIDEFHKYKYFIFIFSCVNLTNPSQVTKLNSVYIFILSGSSELRIYVMTHMYRILMIAHFWYPLSVTHQLLECNTTADLAPVTDLYKYEFDKAISRAFLSQNTVHTIIPTS